MKVAHSGRRGFTLVEIMIVTSIIALLAVIAIPSFIRARDTSNKNSCLNNLRQINAATQQWALETRQLQSATVTEVDVTPYLRKPAVCPAGGTSFNDSYSLSDVATEATCKQVSTTHQF